MSVAVIVPWRGGDPDRERAWDWLAGWWTRESPAWPVLEGTPRSAGPWCKAAAVADALTLTNAEVLVIADADVLVPGVWAAVAAVASGSVAWAMPHKRVYRLTADGTDRLIAHGLTPPPARPVPTRGGQPVGGRLVAASHKGEIGGGCVVLPRALYERAPMDPRFLGWGQEDQAFGRALTVLAGAPWRVDEPLWHLWHQPQPRMTRAKGSPEGMALYRRYRAARTPEEMAALLGEFKPDPQR